MRYNNSLSAFLLIILYMILYTQSFIEQVLYLFSFTFMNHHHNLSSRSDSELF